MTAATAQRTRASRRQSAASSSRDAVTLLKADHRTVERLFKAFERAGATAYKTKRRLVDQMISELSVHAFIEESVLYPFAKYEIASARSEVLEAIEEHHVVKWLLQELIGLDPKVEQFEPKTLVLIENVRHHVQEEEGNLFPLLRSEVPRKRLVELAVELEEAKSTAPTHPHPRLPTGIPEHLLPDGVASVLDRAKEAVKSVRPAS